MTIIEVINKLRFICPGHISVDCEFDCFEGTRISLKWRLYIEKTLNESFFSWDALEKYVHHLFSKECKVFVESFPETEAMLKKEAESCQDSL